MSDIAGPEFTTVATGLSFPEGPVALPDGSLVVVEMFAERLTHIGVDGSLTTIAELPGGPNGVAIGADGAYYVCNNGGTFTPIDLGGLLVPGPFDPSRYIGGSIQRVDCRSGVVTTLYTECDGRPLRGPNDLVMDGHGGFYFTDHGILDGEARTADLTGLYYATCDGTSIREVAFPLHSPNGVGLSPDGHTLYYAETFTGRVFRLPVVSPGVVTAASVIDAGAVLAGLPGLQYLDSLAVDADGWVNVGTLVRGGITSISPDGSTIEFVAVPDPLPTNLCFGGADLRTAYITLSATGQVLSTPWPRTGLRLAHQ